MSDLHIDDFYKDVALTFLRLYASFPRKVILYVDDICGPDTPDEYGLYSERYQSAFSAMVWLAEHGYLSYASNIRQEALDQAVLSDKGFLLLSSRSALIEGDDGESLPPSVQMHQQSHIHQLRKAVSSRNSAALNRFVQYLLSGQVLGD